MNAARACVQRVLQQLFHHRRRTLHHLARGDLVGNVLGKYVDAAHGLSAVAGCWLLVAGKRSLSAMVYSLSRSQASRYFSWRWCGRWGESHTLPPRNSFFRAGRMYQTFAGMT